jgi:hypothetical protein
MTRKLGFTVLVSVAAMVIGLFMIIRSCLSKFDERAAVGGGGGSESASQFLVFEKDGKGVVFSLVKFEKTISYSRSGGMTRRQVRTSYYAQTNDLQSGERTGSEKIGGAKAIKFYPVELMGAVGDNAWLFVGELLAYDPFTLKKRADIETLEQRYPELKGRFPQERRFFEFDPAAGRIRITMNDGSRYALDGSTLALTPLGESDGTDPGEDPREALERRIRAVRDTRKAAYDRLRENNRAFREKLLSREAYSDSSEQIRKITDVLNKELDSLETIQRGLRDEESAREDAERSREMMMEKGFNYGGRIACDSSGGRWYGLYTAESVRKVSERFRFEIAAQNDAAARTRLYTATLSPDGRYWNVGYEKTALGEQVFLQGAFLVDLEKGAPLRLSAPDGYLVVHRDKIGKEGRLQLTRIDRTGKTLWSLPTGLTAFSSWKRRNDRLVLMGKDNENISSGEDNLLLSIDCTNGKAAVYDYVKNAVRSGN